MIKSTGVYWFAAFEALESHGLEVILADAREARAVPGRKSDVNVTGMRIIRAIVAGESAPHAGHSTAASRAESATPPSVCSASVHLKAAFAASQQSYGSRRLVTAMANAGSRWFYLVVVLDLYARKVVGWAMAPTMSAKLVCDALHIAIMHRRPQPRLLVHSDRGSQRAIPGYAEAARLRLQHEP